MRVGTLLRCSSGLLGLSRRSFQLSARLSGHRSGLGRRVPLLHYRSTLRLCLQREESPRVWHCHRSNWWKKKRPLRQALEKLSLQGATGAISTPRGSSATIDEPSFDYQYLRSRRLSNTTGSQQESGELVRPLLGSGASGDQYGGKTRSTGTTSSVTVSHAEPLPSTTISDYRREAMLVREVRTHNYLCRQLN